MEPLRIAVIGMGWAGTRQVEAVRELDRKVVVDCIVDNDADFLKMKAEEFGVSKTYTDFRDALSDPNVHAVSICTPHKLHCPMTLEAAAAKKHITCQKPMALTVEDATRMIETAEANGVKLYVTEDQPYSSVSMFLREIVQSEEYTGELTFASVVNGFRGTNFGYPGRRAWLALPEQGGTGTWTLHGIHSVAQLRYILGEVETVYMQEHHASSYVRKDLEGTMSGLLTMESGIHVSIVQSSESKLYHNLGGYVIHGDRGSIRASRSGCEVFTGDSSTDSPSQFLPYPEQGLSPHARIAEAFADYIAGVSVGPTTGRSERRSLAIVQAGYESAQSGKPINLKDRFGEV
jgi:UDP-N-acetylglucosamine 3-dehydrogenase